jgi:fibronectin-binding autotransporter adhesin
VTFEGGDQLNFYYGASATTGYINYNGPGNILLSRNLYVEGNSGGGVTGAVRIKSDGNVGIGITNPSYKLDINSNIRAYTASSGVSPRLDLGGTIIAEGSTRAGLYILTAGTAAGSYGSIWWGNGNTNTDGFISVENDTRAMRFGTADGTRMSITSNGNVGIGYTNPAYKLQVNGTGYFNETLFVNGITTIEDRMVSIYDMFTGNSVSELEASTTVPGNINFQGVTAQGAGATATTQQGITWQVNNYGGTTNYGIQAQLVVGNNGNVGTFMGLFTSDNYGAAPVERLRIQYNGNVGIGTTSPNALLHVATASTTGTTSMLLLSRASEYGHTLFEQTYDSTYFTAGKTLTLKNDAGTAFIHFAGNNAGTQTNVLIPTGNVGIGTITPSTKLEVGNFLDAFTNKITVSARYEYEPEFNFKLGQSGTNLDWIGAVISSGDDGNYNGKILFKTANAGRDTPTTKMAIKANGYVGIGTVSPSSILQLLPGPSTATNSSYQSFQAGGFGVLFRNAYDAYITFNTTYSPAGWVNKYGTYKSGIMQITDGIFSIDLGTGTTAGGASNLTQRFVITNGGSVGIGTDNPINGSKLEVRGSGVWDGGVITLTNTGTGGRSWSIFSTNNSFGQGGDRLLIYNTTAGTDAMVINSGNNVGIGTNNPSVKLQVVGGIRTNTFSWGDTDNAPLGSLSYGSDFVTMETNAAYPIRLITNGTAALTIDTSQQVGIGITTPSAKLEVVGAVFIPSSNPLYMGGTAGSIGSWGSRQITNSGIHTLSAGAFSVDNSGYVSPVTSSLYVDTLKGNVGIRTTSPAWPLDVVGNARIGDNTSQQKFAALQVSTGQGSATTYRDIDMCGYWAANEGHAITANYGTTSTNIVGQIVFEHNSPGSRIKFGRLYNSGDQSTYPMNLVSNGSNGNLGINTTAPAADLHIDSGATGATAYPFRTDASSLDYALYVSSSGNVAVGGLVPASQLNHKFVVFSGSIALRGPNEAAYSYRLNDTAGTNRNALYVSSSNYLNVGNAAFAGLQLFHTGSFETALDATGEFGVRQIYGNSADNNDVLGVPDKWLAVRINNVNYVMPMYQV